MNKFIIGLILGIAIAAGLAFYLNNMPNQFTKRVMSNNSSGGIVDASGPMILAPGTKLQEMQRPAATGGNYANNPNPGNTNASSANASAAKAAASSPSYDFYDVLQGEKASASGGNVSTQSASQPVRMTNFYAEAGVFANRDLADDMKAQLALLGFSAKIRTQMVSGKLLNRVLVGPFTTESQAQDVINQLSEQKVSAILYRVNN